MRLGSRYSPYRGRKQPRQVSANSAGCRPPSSDFGFYAPQLLLASGKFDGYRNTGGAAGSTSVVVFVVMVVVWPANCFDRSYESGPGSGLYRSRRVTNVVQEHSHITTNKRKATHFTAAMEPEPRSGVNVATAITAKSALPTGAVQTILQVRQGLWTEDLRTPPGQECSNGSLILFAVVLWRTFRPIL